MAAQARVQVRRWLAALIIVVFFVAVAGAAAVGWWYARESPPHQGPILLVSIDGVPAADLSAYGGPRTDTPAIDALARESVVFERAYTNSAQSLPAHASLFTGRLPIDHGVRDDAGFSLPEETNTLAELLRNRGFTTGAAVSTFLLQHRTGIDQGFSFFNDEMPVVSNDLAAIERDGAQTIDVAERWMTTQSGQRYFLFVQIGARDADPAVMRLSAALKQRGLYDDATIVVVGDRGDTTVDVTLDERALRVPLIVKQPKGLGSHRRILSPVQNVDLLPTILDLVRAPVPSGLPGRSLRSVLDDDDTEMPTAPIYSETLAAYFRVGGAPIYALTGDRLRVLRRSGDDLIALTGEAEELEASEAARLRAELDDLLRQARIVAPAPIEPSDEERYALLGYLSAGGQAFPAETDVDASALRALVEQHRAAAVLIGQKRYTAGIRALQALARKYPTLAAIHFQLGNVLTRVGRIEEAIFAFEKVRDLHPEASAAARAMADALLRAGKTDAAREQADIAVMLAAPEGSASLYAAHEIAARAALVDGDGEAATLHGQAAAKVDPSMPLLLLTQGRLHYSAGRYAEAVASFEAAASGLSEHQRRLADLHLFLGESLVRLDRPKEAESHFREELRAFPRNIQAYTSLATLYRRLNEDAAVEEVLNELTSAIPTPAGYNVAATLSTLFGDESRAEALRSDARARFQGDPSLVLLGIDTP